MSLEDRGWYRETERKLNARVGGRALALVFLAAVAGLFLVGLLGWRSGPTESYGGTQHTYMGATKLTILPGLLDITIRGDSLYAKHDPWRAYLADERTCPGGERVNAPLARQAETMVCLVNYARRRRGLPRVATVSILNQTSIAKAEKIARCQDFNHNACGQDAAADIRATGYRGAWGENLFIAGGRYGAPRPTLDGWLNSSHHRENLFRPEWRTQGIAVEKLPTFGRSRNMTLWVNQFGTG